MDALKNVIGCFPGGATTSEIAAKIKMNRNLVAKYLHMMVSSGQLEMRTAGSAKIYSCSDRVPVSDLISHTADAVILLDAEDRILRLNPSAAVLLSLAGEKPDWQKLEDIRHPSARSLSGRVHGSRTGNKQQDPVEIVLEVRGEEHHFILKFLPVVFENGSPGTAVILHDITMEKNLRRIQSVSDAREQGIADDHTEMVVRFLPDGTMTYFNRAFLRFFGYSRQECQGKPFKSLLLFDDQQVFDMVVDGICCTSPVAPFACRTLLHSGEVHFLEWTIRGLCNETGSVSEFQAIGRDITDRNADRERIDRYIADLAFLYMKSRELADLSPDTNIYDVIGKGAHEILPEAGIVVSSVDPAMSGLTVRSCLDDHVSEVISRYLGREFIGMVLRFPESSGSQAMFAAMQSNVLVKIPGDLYVSVLGQVPYDQCKAIEAELDLGDLYTLGLTYRKTLLGVIGVLLPRGAKLRRTEVLEIYSRHAATALQVWHRENQAGSKPDSPAGEVPRLPGASAGYHDLQEKVNRHIADQTFLFMKTRELDDLLPDADMWGVIGRALLELLPGAGIWVNSLDTSSGPCLTPRCCLDHHVREVFSKHLGRDFVGMAFAYPDTSETRIMLEHMQNGKLVKVPGDLHTLDLGLTPVEICNRIERELGLGDLYVIGLTAQRNILGNIVMYLPKGSSPTRNELIEIYCRYAATVLAGRSAPGAENKKGLGNPSRTRVSGIAENP